MNTETTENKDNIFKLHSFMFSEFLARIEKINKKAQKLGLPLVSYKEISREVVPAVKAFECAGTDRKAHPEFEWITIELAGDAPFISGWKLLGVLEHNPGFDVPIIRTVPGQTVPEKYRTDTSRSCEHCESQRNRKETFILQNVESGVTKQIGRNCVADFLPGVSPEAVAKMCSHYISLHSACLGDDEEPFYSDNSPKWDLAVYKIEEILTLAQAIIRVDGWVSKAAASFSEHSTSSSIQKMLRGRPSSGKEREEYDRWVEKRQPDANDEKIALATVEWIKNELEAKSDYGWNLKTIARAGLVNWGNIGITCSAIASYHKHLNRLDSYKKKMENKKDEWVGNLKQRLRDIELKVRNIAHTEGDWGTTHIVAMEDSEGRDYVWFASNLSDPIMRDDVIILTGTVKDHKEFRGRKQTVLTRCKYQMKETRTDSEQTRIEFAVSC